jgi:hypothetical protein
MRTTLCLVMLAACGTDDPLKPSPDASVSVDAPAAPDASAAPTCRRDPTLDEGCRFTFENLNGFTCDPGAPLVGDGYRDCYLSGGLPGDPDFLMCCRDQ